MGFEPTTFSLARRRSTTEPRPRVGLVSDRECRDTESNCGHRDFQSRALPTELSRPDVLLLSVRDFTRRGRSCQAKDVDCYLRFKSGQFKVERWTPGRGAAKGSKVEKWTGCDRVSPKMESDMEQLHKRLSDEQVRLVFKHYGEGRLSRQEAQESLGIGKSHFFALLKSYRRDPEHFTIEYERPTPKKIGMNVEQAIRTELQREKKLVEDKRLPISSYNYSALRDRLQQKGMRVSLPTIIQRAKEQDCYREQKRHKPHDRQVVTTSIGALIQHDASTHLWSPYASEKWTLITSLDDYSRKLLYADFIDQETSWAHIQAAQSLMQTYGLPLKYYVDNLRVFRFVQNRDSVWRQHVLHTDEVDPQWRQVMRLMGVQVSYALSPQAKDHDSYCTSFVGSGMILDAGNRRRFASFRPGILVGASKPGGSNK